MVYHLSLSNLDSITPRYGSASARVHTKKTRCNWLNNETFLAPCPFFVFPDLFLPPFSTAFTVGKSNRGKRLAEWNSSGATGNPRPDIPVASSYPFGTRWSNRLENDEVKNEKGARERKRGEAPSLDR